MNWYLEVLKKYAVFEGRARRKEYWMFLLFNFIISVVIAVFEALIGTEFIGIVYALAIIVPGLAVTIRRLHDTDRSGWWFLIVLIPIIGAIVLTVFTILDSKPGRNRFGENPKGISAY